MSNQKSFWISYDLGLKGDYSGLYSWLDTVKAKECGNNIAYFTMVKKDNLVDLIRTEIQKSVKFSQSDRIYLIYKEDSSGKLKGEFLSGGRKRAPWEGYAIDKTDNEVDVAE